SRARFVQLPDLGVSTSRGPPRRILRPVPHGPVWPLVLCRRAAETVDQTVCLPVNAHVRALWAVGDSPAAQRPGTGRTHAHPAFSHRCVCHSGLAVPDCAPSILAARLPELALRLGGPAVSLQRLVSLSESSRLDRLIERLPLAAASSGDNPGGGMLPGLARPHLRVDRLESVARPTGVGGDGNGHGDG